MALAGLLFCASATSPARDARQNVLATPARVPVIVELFTSEGCSSCPPADELLIDLLDRQPVAGALIVGLSEHVDYWNALGWKDPYSSALFSKRQSDYASVRRLRNVYTPQMVVDGDREFVGSDRDAALQAIQEAAQVAKLPLQLEWSDPGTLQIALPQTGTSATVFLAIVEDGLATSVAKGENAGRRLAHKAVTRRLTEVGRARAGAGFTGKATLALDPAWRRSALRAVVFAARDKDRRIVAAGVLALPS
jgi:hypothetical protein